jgi:phosphatidylglycerol:prolipoprotein diacylglycerol transferase
MHPFLEFTFLGESLQLKTYSLFLYAAVITGVLLSCLALKGKVKYPPLLLAGLSLAFLAGARLLNFTVNHLAYQSGALSLFSMRAVGFSLYGGILAALIVLLVLNCFRKIDIWPTADALVLPFGISFFIMRMGCFLNGCCFGKLTAGPLGVAIPPQAITAISDAPLLNILNPALFKVYPTQLFEGLAALAGVALFFLLRHQFKTTGMLAVCYGMYLTAVRWIVFYLRYYAYPAWVVDYFYPGLYLFLLLVGFAAAIYLRKKAKRGS